jgi:hypothetical protein
MKLVKHADASWLYALNQDEVVLLDGLLKQFPFTGEAPAKISKTDRDPQALERETLLNESQAAHRKELKRQASELLAAGKFQKRDKGYWLSLNSEEREILLQILNDIRVGCWQALGEPDSLDMNQRHYSSAEVARHNLMNLAGYFEHHLICIM